MEDPSPPSDVIADDVPESGDSAAMEDGSEVPMSEEELACYHVYMNRKLDEYEPIWVSSKPMWVSSTHVQCLSGLSLGSMSSRRSRLHE